MTINTLRQGSIEGLKRGLARGILSSHAFETKFNNENGTLIHLIYKDNDSFSFKLLHPKSKENPSNTWKTIECPGRHFLKAENYDHRDFDQAHSSAYAWVDRINEELLLEAKSHNDSSLLDSLREQINNKADSLDDPTQPFNSEELEEWTSQLKGLAKKLKELEEKNEIQSGKIDQLTHELDRLKTQGIKTPKRTWLKTAGNKVLDILEEAPKAAVKSLAEGAVKALLEHK